MLDAIIVDAIKRANKLGAKGIEVVGYTEPYSASQDLRIMLIVKLPELTSACDRAWYE